MLTLCRIRVFLREEMPYFQVECRNQTLQCSNFTCFPCPGEPAGRRGCLALLRSLTEGCSLLQLEGLALLPQKSRRALLLFFAGCASRQGAPLLVL